MNIGPICFTTAKHNTCADSVKYTNPRETINEECFLGETGMQKHDKREKEIFITCGR